MTKDETKNLIKELRAELIRKDEMIKYFATGFNRAVEKLEKLNYEKLISMETQQSLENTANSYLKKIKSYYNKIVKVTKFEIEKGCNDE